MKQSISYTYKLAVSGIITALGSLILILSSVITVGTYSLPVIAGALLCVIVIDFGKPFAYSSFIATSIVSLLISSDKEAVLYYICFFGFYPILKASIEKIDNKILSKALKILIFNICMVALYFIAINLFNIPTENFIIFNINIPLLLLAIGNIFFLVYDIALTKVISVYIKKYRKFIIK